MAASKPRTCFNRALLTYAQNRPIFQHEKPYSVLSYLKDGAVTSNLTWEHGEEEEMHDLRQTKEEVGLDSHGFCFCVAPTKFAGWQSRKEVEEEYLPEVKELIIREIDDVDEVQIFDWRKRGFQGRDSDPFTDMNDPSAPLIPAQQVHLDQSPAGLLKRVRRANGDRAEFLLQGRVRIINVWRPLDDVEDWPLALCDGKSIAYDDLLEVDLIRKDYIGSTMYATYRPGYKWYFLDRQKPYEVCLFKNFDSDTTVDAQMCPHVSFHQETASQDAKPRESIEVRALVFTYPRN